MHGDVLNSSISEISCIIYGPLWQKRSLFDCFPDIPINVNIYSYLSTCIGQYIYIFSDVCMYVREISFKP